MHRITSLYPQYQRSQDRRQQNIPVAVERRSGRDRRSADRVQLDSQLTRDIFEVKSKVAKLESIAPKLFESNVTTKPVLFGNMNTGHDQLVKETKELKLKEIERQEEKLQDKASLSFQAGVIAAALGFGIAISYLSSVGTIIAIGTAVYVGGRIIKALIVKEMKEEDNTTKKTK